MTYEVEIKFPLNSPDAVIRQLMEMGAVRHDAVEQSDRYFAHPSRDFAQTDEALRIRTVGSQSCVTYKGPKVDALTKTRREIEVPIGRTADDAPQFAELLTSLAFREVKTVVKERTPYALVWENRSVELSLDRVEGLGTFLELEVIADESERDDARDSLLRLAQRLGMKDSERRSYLALLLEKEGA